MEIEKIKVLLFSSNFDDVLLGMEFLMKEPDIIETVLKIEKKAKNPKNDGVFDYQLRLKLPDIPLEYRDTYFIRGDYFVEIMKDYLYIDTPEVARKRIEAGDNHFSSEL